MVLTMKKNQETLLKNISEGEVQSGDSQIKRNKGKEKITNIYLKKT